VVIVHVIADLSTGGAELMMKRLIEAHRHNADFEHHVISLHGMGRVGPELIELGVSVQALGMRGIADIPRMVRLLVRRFRELRPDLVHAWMYHANFLAGLAALASGYRRVIWAIRASELDRTMGVSRTTLLLRRLSAPLSHRLPRANVYVVHSARKAHESLGYDRSKGMVIPNGYPDLGHRSYPEARSRLGVPEGCIVIGSIGRFNAAKDPRTFIEAAALVAQPNPTALFLMVGRGMSPDNRELAAVMDAKGLADRIVLAGEHADVYECLAAMDIFCLHSVTEAFPNVVGEAMNAGVPTVVTDVGDAAAVLGDCGIVVAPRDPAALARAIIEMIEKTPAERLACSKRGRERIVEYFSLPSVVERYEQLYREVAG
jgi:glycosyltransferase involved in cell wall biosynthesis